MAVLFPLKVIQKVAQGQLLAAPCSALSRGSYSDTWWPGCVPAPERRVKSVRRGACVHMRVQERETGDEGPHGRLTAGENPENNLWPCNRLGSQDPLPSFPRALQTGTLVISTRDWLTDSFPLPRFMLTKSHSNRICEKPSY